jgi:hypothetical protein
MKTILCAMAVALAGHTALAQQLVTDRPDHTILVSIESDPSGLELYSVPATTNDEVVKIGTTPHVCVVELRWGKGWLRKKWKNLSVKTIGNVCSLEYDPKTKQYDLSMKFRAQAAVGMDKIVDEHLASFAYYEDLDFDHLKGIPNRATIKVAVEAASAQGGAQRRSQASPTTVMMAAEGQQGRFGTLALDANVDGAEVIVDGKPAGVTPVKLVLSAGDHDVVVQKRGYRMYQSQISIAAESETALKAKLDVAQP